MAEPITGGVGLWDVAKWLFGVAVGLIAYIGKRHDERLTSLEKDTKPRAEADKERSELLDALREHRSETNAKFDRMFERLDALFDRLAK